MINLWITQSYLKSFTPLNNNIDVSEVANHIETAQLIYTREILGKNLYDDLDAKIIAASFSTAEGELIDILKQGIAYRASEIAVPFLSIKLRSKGAVRLRDEFAEPASLEDMKYIRHELKNRAEYYETRAKDYLCLYPSEFPLWLKSGNPKQEIYPNLDQSYDSDIYLDGGSAELRRNRYYYGPNGSNNNTY
jgi:hypothetical protein